MPPRRAERLLGRLIPDARWRDIALGDLAEEFDARAQRHPIWRARLWYWRQVLAFAPAWLSTAAAGLRTSSGDSVRQILLAEARQALRALLHRPLLTTAIVLTLVLTIGGGVVTFGMVDRLVLRPFSGLASDRLVLVSESANPNQRRSGIPVWRFAQWRDRTTTLDQLVAFRPFSANLTADAGYAERVDGQRVSSGFFNLLGIVPALGRPITPEDEVPGVRRVVLSDALWQRLFAGDASAVGRAIQLDGETYDVVGIAPPGFSFPDGSELWAALPIAARGRPGSTPAVSAMALLRPDATPEAAAADIGGLFAQQRTEDPTIDSRRRVWVRPFTEGMIDNGLPMMVGLLQATALFVLLIGCANVAGLLLARGVERRRDVSVRRALGATRVRIVRQLLMEGLVLALIAVPGALLAAWALFQALHRSMPAGMLRYIPGWAALGVDTRLVVAAIAASAGAGLLFSVLPALAASRVAPGLTVRDGNRAIAGGPGRLRYGLVVLQIALALPLLASAGMTARAGWAMAFGPQGYEPDGLYQLRTVLTPSRYATDSAQAAFVDRLVETARQVPGVTGVGVTSVLPSTMTYSDRRVLIDGAAEEPDQPRYANYRQVSAGYLETMRIPIVSGRAIAAGDTAGTSRVSVVSASLARRYFGGDSPLGRRIQAGTTDETWTTIVGVAGDTIDDMYNARGVPTLYVPFAQNPTTQLHLVARTAGDPAQLATGLQRAITSVDAGQPAFDGAPMRDRIHDRTVGLRLLAGLMSGLGLVTLVLSAFGIYSLMASNVALRRREFGIRMALGASAGAVLGMTLRHGAVVALAGLCIGLPATVLVGRLMESTLFGLLDADPVLVAGVTVVLAAVALVATIIPARRATKLNPALVIRE